MAFITNPDEEEKKQQEATGPETILTTTPGPELTDGGSNQASSTSGISSTSGNPKSGGSNGWTNVQEYQKANPEASGIMGAAISNPVNQASIDLNNQQQNYQQSYNTAKPKYNSINDQSALDALSSGNIAKNKDQIAGVYNASYTGPKDYTEVNGFSPVDNGLNSLSQQGNNLGNDSGRMVQLNSVYGNASPYSQGEKSLDSFLVGAGEKGQQAITGAQNNVNQSKNAWKQTLADISNSIANDQRYENNLQSEAKAAAAGQQQNLNSILTNNYNNLQNQNLSNKQAVQNLQNQISYDPNAAYNTLGLSPDVGKLFTSEGGNLNSLFSANGPQSLGDVTSQNDSDNYLALMNIMGQQPGYDLSKSGQTNNTPFTINSEKTQQANQLAQLNTAIAQQLQDQQAKNSSTLNQLMQYAAPVPAMLYKSPAEIGVAANMLGISPDDYKLALQNGLDLSQFVQKGANITSQDVINPNQASQWNSLRTSLGLSAAPIYNNGPVNQVPAFSLGDIQGAINQLKQGIQKPVANTAKSNLPAPTLSNMGTLQTPISTFNISLPDERSLATTPIFNKASNVPQMPNGLNKKKDITYV